MFPSLPPCGQGCAPPETATALPALRRRTVNKIVHPDDLKAGDVIGFSGNSWISGLINVGTYGLPWWDISHVGIMAHADDGRLLLFESTTLENMPCEIAGQCFDGTQAHVLDKMLPAYNGKVWHYPLYRPLYESEDKRLTEFLMVTIHTPYDEMGAFRSAGVGLSWIESCFREQDLHMIFCSEWVAAGLSNIGIFNTSDSARWNPNHLCRTLRRRELVFKPRRMR
jgi:hypothetical protein